LQRTLTAGRSASFSCVSPAAARCCHSSLPNAEDSERRDALPRRENRGKRCPTSTSFVVKSRLYHGFYHGKAWTTAYRPGQFAAKPRWSGRQWTTEDGCRIFPKVEVAGSSPVPRSISGLPISGLPSRVDLRGRSRGRYLSREGNLC
jgi:hypothetical protein